MYILSVRISEQDREAIKIFAGEANMSVSEYIRYRALKKALGEREELQMILVELMRNRELLMGMRPDEPGYNAEVRGRVEAIPGDLLLARAMRLRKRTL